MFKEILKIEFSELENIITNPAQFLQQEYNLDLSNNEIYFTVIAILLFIVGVSFELLKTKKNPNPTKNTVKKWGGRGQ